MNAASQLLARLTKLRRHHRRLCPGPVRRTTHADEIEQLVNDFIALTRDAGLHIRIQAARKWNIEGDRLTEWTANTYRSIVKPRTLTAIKELKDHDGSIHSDPCELTRIAREFYTDLYKAAPSDREKRDELFNDLREYLNGTDRPGPIDEETKKLVGRPFTLAEI